jgi:hypothetical protein
MAQIHLQKETERRLWAELEGGLFVHVYISTFHGYKQKIFNLSQDYYTVKDAKVLQIHKNGLSETNDDLWTFVTQCKKVGKYNPNKKYKNKHTEIPYNVILPLFKPTK